MLRKLLRFNSFYAENVARLLLCYYEKILIEFLLRIASGLSHDFTFFYIKQTI